MREERSDSVFEYAIAACRFRVWNLRHVLGISTLRMSSAEQACRAYGARDFLSSFSHGVAEG
jgi:hypothetical protein